MPDSISPYGISGVALGSETDLQLCGDTIASVRALAIPLLLVLLLQPVVNSFTVGKPCCCSKSGSCPLKKNSCSLRNLQTDSIASESRDISSPAEATFSVQRPMVHDAALAVLITAPRDFSTPPDIPPPRV